MKKTNIILYAFCAVLLSSCAKEGCTDRFATNFDSSAKDNDGSCIYTYGCTDFDAINYDASAVKSDNSCQFMGDVMFWTNENVQFDVFIENVNRGRNTVYYDAYSPSNCGESGNVNLSLEPGFYNAIIKYDDFWNSQQNVTFEISSEGCTLMLVFP